MIEWFEENRRISLTITFLIGVAIFFISSIPGSITAGIGPSNWLATTYHFLVFFLFSSFLLISIKGQRKIKLTHAIISFILSLIYAISDEIHQLYVPFRHASTGDVIIDSLGILLSSIIYYKYFKN